MTSEKDKTKSLRQSDEYKKKIDEEMQKIDMSFEDLKLGGEGERSEETQRYRVDIVDEDDISLINESSGMPVIVDTNEISKKSGVEEGDLIEATIFSELDENGMTSHWEFKQIKKL